jgi:tetratricopeptide (TPR) repeat protein
MERSRELDAVSGATITIKKHEPIAPLLIFLFFCCQHTAFSQNRPDSIASIKTLFDNKRWSQIVESVKAPSRDNADLNYYYGSAAAQLGQWQKARAAFLVGAHLSPADPRFPVELGGVAFRQKRYSEAARWLQRAVDLAPQDQYANEFLATIYFINGNLEAAVKYWNRIGMPQLENVRTRPLRIKPALLDRAITFSPASVLSLQDYLTTQERLDGLGIFQGHDYRLTLRPDGKFDALLMAGERNGMGVDKFQALASTFQGVFYDTIYPQYFNIGRSAKNFRSLVRWDPEKRRIAANFSEPVRDNPKYRLQIGTDLRNENWEIRQPATPSGLVAGALNIRRESAEAQFSSFNSWRWGWSSGFEFSHRDYRNITGGSMVAQNTLIQGYGLKHFAKLNYQFVRIPERRFNSTATFSAQTGTIGTPAHAFEKLEVAVKGNWFPTLNGDDYYTHAQVRYGKTFGQVPFDEMYVLGLERDTDLPMRAHVGTSHGIKGSAPIGRNYFLANMETDKKVYGTNVFDVKLTPFLDVGKTTDPVPELGSKKWLYDTGMQIKVRVWGIGFAATYGKDLRSGQSAFFFTAGR